MMDEIFSLFRNDGENDDQLLRMWSVEQAIKNNGAYQGGQSPTTLVVDAETIFQYIKNGPK